MQAWPLGVLVCKLEEVIFFFSETQQQFLWQIGFFVCADGFSHPKGSTACTSAANHGGCEDGPTGESSSALAVPP